MIGYTVEKIERSLCENFILNIHYAKRYPSITHAFGLFFNRELVGIVTYGTPPSSTLRTGLLGKEYSHKVLELNRLCLLYNKKNEASFLVSSSLKLLPESAVISYADISQGHIGYVYQACNFIYCGLSAKRTDWCIRGMEHLHNTTIGDEFRGVPNRSQKLREKYGDNFYLKDRPRKHRYVYFTGNKRWKKIARNLLKYPVSEYPK